MKDPDASDEQLVYQPEPTLADCLKAWRHRTGYTQIQTAALLQVPPTTYMGWEQGRPTPYGFMIMTTLHALTQEPANAEA